MKLFKHAMINYVVINGFAIIVYFVVLAMLNFDVSEEIMFSTPDSKSYLAVANWLSYNVDTSALSIRPIMYPIILLVGSKLGGIYGIWITQFLFWLATINFTFWSLKELTKNSNYAYLGSFIIIGNLSLISLTWHALTEVTTAFLLAILVAFIVKNRKRSKDLYFVQGCLFFMVLLTIVKPVFSIPLYILLIISIFQFKSYKKSPHKILHFFLILTPLLVQITIMKINFNKVEISEVGSLAVNQYIFAQGIQLINKDQRSDAMNKAIAYSNNERITYILRHKSVFFSLFIDNLEDNVKADPSFLNPSAENGNLLLYKVMLIFNKIYYYSHQVFILIYILSLILFFKYRDYSSLLFVSGLYFLCAYYILVTGISFWQGDRLVLPSISIWALLYPYLIFYNLNSLLNEPFKLG